MNRVSVHTNTENKTKWAMKNERRNSAHNPPEICHFVEISVYYMPKEIEITTPCGFQLNVQLL